MRTSSPRPRRSPGPSRSPSSKASGSVAARRAATVGRCMETVHGWTETGSRGRSGQAATALPSLAQRSALSHHCAHAPGAAGNDQDRYVMTALACYSRGSMPAGCVCHVHTRPRLASWTVTMSPHGTTGNGVSRAAMPHGNATAHSVRPPLSTAYPTAGSPPPCAFTTTSRSNVPWPRPWPWLRSRLRAPTRAMAWRIRSNS